VVWKNRWAALSLGQAYPRSSVSPEKMLPSFEYSVLNENPERQHIFLRVGVREPGSRLNLQV